MVRVTIEDDIGRQLATIHVDHVPRVGDHINTIDGLRVVTVVIWDLTDGPLTAVTVIVQPA